MRDLWDTLRETSAPILLYGMGNGADKALAVCAQKGIPVVGVFASDGFARGNLFHGMEVMNYAQAKEKFKDFTVLVCFATRKREVLENIRRIAKEKRLYVPDLPVAGSQIFDGTFFDLHEKDLVSARSLLADERSKVVFDLAVQSKLTGELSFLLSGTTEPEDDYREILHPENYKICGDLGAYTGDTAKDLAARCPGIQEIVSLEPDPKTFEKLKRNTSLLPVRALRCAAWSREEDLLFGASGNRGSGWDAKGKKQIEVRGVPGDRIFENRKADYLKFDVEGAELEALKGFRKTIDRDRPELLVSCYHRAEDLFALPLYLREVHPFYRLYLRRHPGVPAWDINLYALPGQSPM